MRTLSMLAVAMLVALVGCSGSPRSDDRVTEDSLVGGRAARAGEYPATVLIRLGCTAARVGPRHLLTAAHCVWNGKEGAFLPGYRPGDRVHITPRKSTSAAGVLAWQLGGFREAVIEETFVPDDWKKIASDVAILDASAPRDVALVVVKDASSWKDIPQANIDAGYVAPGDRVTIMGYGCQTGVKHASDIGQLLFFTLKLSDTRALEPSMLLHRGSFVSSLSTPFGKNLVEHDFFTPGNKMDSKAASLCPGDSGAPVYRTNTNEIVGVNAYYSFLPTSEDADGISMTNWHTRASDVAGFLDEHGANVAY